MSTDTKILSQIINDNKNMNENNDSNKNTSCTPRNALFCCSSPVCLKIPTAPKILPIDYHYQQTVDNQLTNHNESSIIEEHNNIGEQRKFDKINIPLSVPDLAKMNAMTTNTNGIIINGDVTYNEINSNNKFNDKNESEQDMKKLRRKIRTPPAPNEKLGVILKKVTPPKTKIAVKHSEGPMLGVVLRKVEKKIEPVKSILDDNKPLYHLTVVRNRNKSKSTGKSKIAAEQQQKQQQQKGTATTSAKKTADNRLSTYDFPHCEHEKNLQKIDVIIAPNSMNVSSSQVNENLLSFDKTVEIDNKTSNPMNHDETESNSVNTTNTTSLGANNSKQCELSKTTISSNTAIREISSDSSLSSASPCTSVSPPLNALQQSLCCKKPLKELSPYSHLRSGDLKKLSETGVQSNKNPSKNNEKYSTCLKDDKQIARFELTKPPDKKFQEIDKQNTNTHNRNDFYSAEIDYMNNYLKSLPDYSELDKKIHKEFQKCEDLYDQIKSINSGITAVQKQTKNQSIPKSFSQHNLLKQLSNPSQSITNCTSNLNKSTEQSNKQSTSNTIKYPSIFAPSNKNKLTRSISSSNMPGNQKFCIDHPEIPGFIPKSVQTLKSSGFDGIKKSSSNSCIIRPSGKQLMNEFWTENVAEKNAKKTSWNYDKIMASSSGSTSRNSISRKGVLPSEKQGNKDHCQKKMNMCLSEFDNKIRQDVSKEELYKIICNDQTNSNNIKSPQPKKFPSKTTSNKTSDALLVDIENIPGFMNLNKSVSLSSMPGLLKSGSRSYIPCYQKPLSSPNKSSSNSQIMPKQVNSNQIPITYNCTSAPKLHQQQFYNPSGLLKSSSSSCVLSNRNNHYQPFFMQKREINKNPQLDFRELCPSNDKSSKKNEIHPGILPKDQKRSTKLDPNTAVKLQQQLNSGQKLFGVSHADSTRVPRDHKNYHGQRHNVSTQNTTKSSLNMPQATPATTSEVQKSEHLQNYCPSNSVNPMSMSSSDNDGGTLKQQLPNSNYQSLVKTINNTNWEISKKQKDVENNIEKCLNDMLRITSNYTRSPASNQKQSSKPLPMDSHPYENYKNISGIQKIGHKPLPLGKSNSTSSICQLQQSSSHQARLNQLRNKKLNTNCCNNSLKPEIQNCNMTDKFVSSVSPVQIGNSRKLQSNYTNIQPSGSSKNLVGGHTNENQIPVRTTSFSKNLNKKSDSNLYKKSENKSVANISSIPTNRYISSAYTVAQAPSIQSSPSFVSSSSHSSYPLQRCKKNSTSVGKTASNTTRLAVNQGSGIDRTTENGYYDEQIQSDILKTFDPYFYHIQPPSFTPPQNQLVKCNPPMPTGECCIDQMRPTLNEQQQQQQQCILRAAAATNGQNSNIPLQAAASAAAMDLPPGTQHPSSTLLGYEFPPPLSKMPIPSTSRFENLIDSCILSKSSEIYFEQPKPPIQDDADGHLIYHTGDILHNRYKIMATLGEGTFGRVVKVKDMERDHCMALKIIKNVEKYREAAKLEINALEKISQKDPNCDHLCVRMLDWFDYHGHMCIAFEMLGLSVFDFLRENNYEPYPLDQVRHMGYQLCYSVKFLHDSRLTHTDLKPENILFVDSEYTTHYNHKKNREVRRVKCTDVRLIDFGSATFDHEHHSTIVSTRHYRAPEVILELGWSQPCDVWSIGCILFELYLGITLFQTHDNREHLAMMERILGQIPYRMARKTKTKFFYHGKLDWDEKSSAGRYVRDHCKPLFRYLMSDSEDHMQLFDLIKKMLEYEPSQRITLGEAIRHPFFEKLPPHQRLGEDSKITSGSSSRERSHSLSR